MDWEAWRAAVHGVAQSQTLLSDWTELAKKIIILSRPGYQFLLWIRDTEKVREQSKKTIQSLQMFPRMVSLRQGGMC